MQLSDEMITNQPLIKLDLGFTIKIKMNEYVLFLSHLEAINPTY